MRALETKNQMNHRPSARQSESQIAFPRFRLIDGSHPFKKAVPGAYVDYQARTRHGGKVVYFNFELAKEMGLIPADTPHEMTEALSKAVLETFAIQIINEYDIIHKTPIPPEDIKPGRYMATRYLQLQHPDKKGTTSGDGRSIWNGTIRHKGVSWDISSCGTGATCLSPATAIEGRFFKTGTTMASYGCGLSDVGEGLSAALMSNIFHRNGLATERSLCVIEFPQGRSINVRAARNLLRPSHFFNHLKQGNIERLKQAIDYFIDRQVANGEMKRQETPEKTYKEMVRQIALKFAKATARFESDYIFVWLDWDGDNVLTDGGIIDYGSVRQFGLFHHEYRYDDVDRFSTTIPEQRRKAREIVQTFVQIADYLSTGVRKSKHKFAKHEFIRLYDKEFDEHLLKNLLHKIGLNKNQSEYLLSKQMRLVKQFKAAHGYFERAKSSRGKYSVGDGITCDAIYCMRDIQRELPIYFLRNKELPAEKQFLEMMASSYAKKKDLVVTPQRRQRINQFMRLYLRMMTTLAEANNSSIEHVFSEVVMRSSVINMADRITGDAIISITAQLVRGKKDMSFSELQSIMEHFVDCQRRNPSIPTTQKGPSLLPRGKPLALLQRMLGIVHKLREGI